MHRLQNAASDIQDQAEQQDGVDCARARKWYEMAAAGGDTSAAKALSQMNTAKNK
jgi:TPR repeat protein